MTIPLAGFAFGYAFGRWWSLLAVIPLGSWILATNELEGYIGLWVAVALRRLRDRRLHA